MACRVKGKDMADASQFEIMALAPAEWAHPGIAIATARAGGIGLLDLESCADADLARANFARLLRATEARIGLRITQETLALGAALIDEAGERRLTLILAGSSAAMAAFASELPVQHSVLAELTAVSALNELQWQPSGLIAKGHEAPGWVGEDTSYILLQKLMAQTRLPVYVRGGVGLHTAAACRAAGAAGIVLDDQVLLLDESPLAEPIKTELARLTGAETRLFGELAGKACRVYARPAAAVLKEADAEHRQLDAGALALDAWSARLAARIGWSDDALWPIGQGIGVAPLYRSRYKRVGRLVQALRSGSFAALRDAARLAALGPDSALARSHGTRYPLAQGPMTRVSDNPAFAAAVTTGGALPFLALALIRGPQVREMLEQTRQLAGDRPWGVGMLGFIPQALRDEQCAEIWQCKPPYALIAGGRPDQAAEFEQRGIATYIHAPAPALLKMYLEQGAKRFVFEGRECGGHVGPLASFALWEQMVEVLIEQVKPGSEEQIHLLFAGGINDARSGAMLAALTAPLAARGMKVGALMGTAYLFTEEIVSSGAVVRGFQEQAIACKKTVNVESGPGHSTRCADTQFARDFYAARRQLLKDNKSTDEIRDALEDMNLGRLRIASKGKVRGESGALVEVAPGQQLSEGMYMIGQVATVTERVRTIAQLHREVCEDSVAELARHGTAVEEKVQKAKPSDIAIVGIGCLLPKADGGESFWDNVLNQVNVIREVPKSRWDWEMYYDPDRNARDKVNSKWGGFLDEVVFDPIRYGIPPRSMKAIDPMQLLALETASRAMEDAGLSDVDREHTSVIMGAGGGLGDLGIQYGLRAELPRYVANLDDAAMERLPEWTNESFPGMLLNVVTGRIANRLDFGGLNFTIDAACASSLAAVSLAINELESGRSNVALAGGVDTVQSIYGFMSFSKTQALSPQGKARTFDKNADGIVISEGMALVVLKRLADAERDGDRIYAVIKACAGSSDGKALGLTAPLPEGQMRAVNRAYAKAGFSPEQLELIEAHGTGTPVGDRAEAETITRTLTAHGAAPKSVAVGSVKSILGHTKSAAGVVGLIKTTLALHHRVLPAHAGVETPLDTLADPASPAYLLKNPRPWLAHPDGRPRRAGVSAFGFGGTNFHAVLEEYREDLGRAETAGSANWPYELFVFRAADKAGLQKDVERLCAALKQGSNARLRDLAFSLAGAADKQQGARACLAVAAKSLAGLQADLELAAEALAGRSSKPLPPHIKLALERPAQAPALAFVFPGQGAQSVNMALESALFLEELRTAVEHADRVFENQLPQRLSRVMWPEAAYTADVEAAQLKRLTDTRFAQPAIGAVELGFLGIARRLGLKPAATAGHSYGEFAALHAAGVFDQDSFLRLSATRGEVMARAAAAGISGAMAAVQAARPDVSSRIAAFAGVKVANHNGPEQTVISGPAAEVDRAIAALTAEGLRVTKLAVAGAFHTELMAPAQPPLSQAIAATAFRAPQIPVYSNGTGARYPTDPEAARQLLDGHLLQSVEFVTELRAMYADGVRVFLELGPKSICSNMVAATLAGTEARAVSLDGQGGGLRGLLSGLADLLAAGIDFEVSRLFAGRRARSLPLQQLGELLKAPPVAKTAWYVSGGCARPQDDAQIRTGKELALTRERGEQVKASIIRSLTPAPLVMPAAAAATSAPAPALMQAPGAAVSSSSDALTAYHETMRQFLALQERVMNQFLGGAPVQIPMPAMTAPLAIQPAELLPKADLPASVQPAPAPMVTPAPAAVTPDVRAVLLKIVAEKTGYPEEMLGLDADLEADLGIDSIKRVEIVGSLQKTLPAPAAATMQSQMERFTRAKTLRSIVDSLPSLAMDSVPAVPAPIAAATPVATMATDLRASLLNIVAEKTGYPEDMLGLDADLEADLGIDSIKRVEIVGSLQKCLPAHVASSMQSQMERFTRAKSLRSILDSLSSLGAVSAPPAAVASAAPVTPVPDVRLTLLKIVAEKTGYPEDMLGLDADLEADLGIDSIKRVEIVGSLQKALPSPVGAAMQPQMERFTRAKNLRAILDALAALGTAAPRVVAAAAVAPVPAVAIKVDLPGILLKIVAEKTGYPEDMLGLDADLEADLGIDSIKRVEIVGALKAQLPQALATRLAASMETFTRAKTLGLILKHLESEPLLQPAATPVRAPVPVTSTASAAPVVDAPRYVIRPRPAPLPASRSKLSGVVIVAGGDEGVAAPLVQKLAVAGLKPVRVSATDAAGIAKDVAAARAQGAICGLLHLHGLREAVPETIQDWRALGEQTVISLFRLCKALLPELPALHVRAATRLGGTFGRDAVGSGTPLAGGVVGFLNCLRHEYPKASVRSVDFNGQTDATIAAHLCDEFFTDESIVEAGYTGDARFSVMSTEQPLAETPFAANIKPAADWIVLATGGARGITAALLDEMAVPGITYVLMGRTPLPGAEDAALASAADPAALKRVLLDQARARGETLKPIELERRCGRVLADREIRASLALLAARGAKLDYVSCDVRDAEAFGAELDNVYRRHGKLDAVLHGAGVIEDKLVADKTEESFLRVFGTKLDSTFVLTRKLKPETLKLLLFFTSVAGRYGNLGQGDYAAANEAVNRIAWDLSRRWTHTRVLAVNWGPWDAGMASEGVKRQFREKGMEPIALSAGRRYLMQELAWGSRQDVEVAVGRGPWRELEGSVEIAAAQDSTAAVTPFLREPLHMGAGGALMLTHRFSLASDPYLANYRVDGKPALSAAAIVEWFAQIASAGWQGWQVIQLREFHTSELFVLDGEQGERDALFRARASSHSTPGEQMVSIELLDAARKTSVARAAVRLALRSEESPLSPARPAAGAAATRPINSVVPGLKLEGAVCQLSAESVEAELQPTTPQLWGVRGNGWLFDPGLLEAASMLAMHWAEHIHGTRVAPAKAYASLQRYGREPLAGPLRLVLRPRTDTPGVGLSFDLEVVDANRKVRLSLENLSCVETPAQDRQAM